MIFVGLGSNIGDREKNIAAALAGLAAHPQIRLGAISSLYQTAPVGFAAQPDFLNAVASLITTLPPEELLDVCLAVEHQLGRLRAERWGPRTIDIDLLLYHDVEYQSEKLILPHPRLRERCFVLVPLAEIAPDVPLFDRLTARELLTNCPDQQVHYYKQLTREEP
jgi:2-amino-4-hydroxy-6-hydroxymethyldihydropteridine diphosphokinase